MTNIYVTVPSACRSSFQEKVQLIFYYPDYRDMTGIIFQYTVALMLRASGQL